MIGIVFAIAVMWGIAMHDVKHPRPHKEVFMAKDVETYKDMLDNQIDREIFKAKHEGKTR